MSLAAQLVAGILAALGLVATGWKLGIDHEKAKQADVAQAIQQTRDAAQQGAADAIVKAAAENTRIVTKVKTVTREVPVYSAAECQHDDRVWNDLNGALRGEPAGPGLVPPRPGRAP